MAVHDIIIIGGGIVGVSTALALKQQFPDADILLLEKQDRLASHQTGHNSGVVHAGVYYAPGSLKADFCVRGALATRNFCREHGLPFRRCGKLLVATTRTELERMQILAGRCRQNGITVHRITARELTRMEPWIQGLGALHVPSTAICDFVAVTRTMADLFRKLGGHIHMGFAVTHLKETRDHVVITSRSHTISARYVVACAGLMADRVARMLIPDSDFQIVPFRGEYFRLPPRWSHRISRLIYPVPDPDLPFLGVHLTPMISGDVTVGPNAVTGWKREGYGRVNISLPDTLQTLSFPGFWRLARQHWLSGIQEQIDALVTSGFLRRAQKYCPTLSLPDMLPYPAGIRAQAVRRDGSLIHDFLFATTPRSLHVCNAPSPAATSAIPIGHYLRDMAVRQFDLSGPDVHSQQGISHAKGAVR